MFANAAIHFGSLVDLTLGVRESWDEKEFTNELFASDNFVPQFGGSTIVSAKDDWNATDYRATVDFNVTDDVMLYLTSSKAFRRARPSTSPSAARSKASTPSSRAARIMPTSPGPT